jgi:hypothetical protein
MVLGDQYYPRHCNLPRRSSSARKSESDVDEIEEEEQEHSIVVHQKHGNSLPEEETARSSLLCGTSESSGTSRTQSLSENDSHSSSSSTTEDDEDEDDGDCENHDKVWTPPSCWSDHQSSSSRGDPSFSKDDEKQEQKEEEPKQSTDVSGKQEPGKGFREADKRIGTSVSGNDDHGPCPPHHYPADESQLSLRQPKPEPQTETATSDQGQEKQQQSSSSCLSLTTTSEGSTCRSLVAAAAGPPPVPFPQQPSYNTVSKEEQDRHHQEIQSAMEALEFMRRANLVVEFGPHVDLSACVHCLRQQRQQKQPQNQFQLPGFQRKVRRCLICQSPVCHHHVDVDFWNEQNVLMCLDCAPLFDLDYLVECLYDNDNKDSNDCTSTTRDLHNKKEQRLHQLSILYDQALLSLKHSLSQSLDDSNQQRLLQTNWTREQLGLGSTITNIASGITGLAATAVFFTPIGPSLLMASLALGGIATAVGSGSFLVEKLCPQTQKAEQTIALATMVDSLLEVTSVIRQARVLNSKPSPCLLSESDSTNADDADDDHHPSNRKKRQALPPSENVAAAAAADKDLGESESSSSVLMHLEEDREQQWIIAKFKAQKAQPPNPIQKFIIAMQHPHKKKEQHEASSKSNKHRHYHQRRDSEARLDDLVEEVEQEEQQGTLPKLLRSIGTSIHHAKHKADHAVKVAQTAKTLATVGMSAGSAASGSSRRHRRRRASRTEEWPTIASVADVDDSTTSEGDDDSEELIVHNSDVKNSKSKNNSKSANKDHYDTETTSSCKKNGFQLFVEEILSAIANQNEKGRRHQEADRKGEELESEDHNNKTAVEVRDDRRNARKRCNLLLQQKQDGVSELLAKAFLAHGSNPQEDVIAAERALIAKIRRKNTELRLRSSARSMKELTRTGFRVAKQSACNMRLRTSLFATMGCDDHYHQPSAGDRMVVKQARFAVKASLTVLREAARYAGGAFSAAIVCVETVELQKTMERIGAGMPCERADTLYKLQQEVLWGETSNNDNNASSTRKCAFPDRPFDFHDEQEQPLLSKQPDKTNQYSSISSSNEFSDEADERSDQRRAIVLEALTPSTTSNGTEPKDSPSLLPPALYNSSVAGGSLEKRNKEYRSRDNMNK